MRVRYAAVLLALVLGPWVERVAADETADRDRHAALLRRLELARASASDERDRAQVARDLYGAFDALARRGHAGSALWCLEHFAAGRPPSAAATWTPEERAARLRLHDALARSAAHALGEDWFVLLEADGAKLGTERLVELLTEFSARRDVGALAARARLAAARILDDGTGTGSRIGSDLARTRRARALALLTRILRDDPGSPLAGTARAHRWRLSNLAPGCSAPDFVTHDHAGNEIRLSDYGGQVVVVRLWGADEPAERTRLRAEERLARRLWDERFALIGVAHDWRRSALREYIEDEGVHWSVAFEPPSKVGAATTWRLAEPVTVLLDPHGVVRAVDLDGEALEREVERLLADLRASTMKRERALDASSSLSGER